MKIRYLFNSKDISSQEEKYLDKKISKLDKLFKDLKDDEVKMDVEVHQNKRGFWRIEMMVRTPYEKFRVKKKDKDFMTAVDMTEGVMARQIRNK